jgi:hypothetical protein
MPAQKPHKTDYAGVYFIWGIHRVTGKPEKIFYITYRKKGKRISEKVGRQSEDMTPARASQRRALRLAGKELTNSEKRAAGRRLKRLKPTDDRQEEKKPVFGFSGFSFIKFLVDKRENNPQGIKTYPGIYMAFLLLLSICPLP